PFHSSRYGCCYRRIHKKAPFGYLLHDGAIISMIGARQHKKRLLLKEDRCGDSVEGKKLWSQLSSELAEKR
ncbi:MAG TPA: hypothetical protein VGN15_01675, partial [Ktedonobacteraceae bacterium]|nr:hypothetical protein [Ktedonobacteraceae bacterium]